MLILATVARLLDVATFGAFSTIIALWFLVEIAFRATVLNTLIVAHASSSRPDHLFGGWFLLTIIVPVALATPAIAVLGVLLQPAEYAHAVSRNAFLIILPYAAFHSLRLALILTDRPLATIVMSASLLILCSSSVAAIWAGLLPRTLVTVCVLIAFAHVSAIAVGWFLSSIRIRFSARYLTCLAGRLFKNRSIALATVVLDAPTGFFSVALGWMSGAAETAHYMASKTLLRPAGIILSAVDDADRAEAARSFNAGRLAAVAAWYRKARFVALWVAFLPLIFIFLFGEELAAILYGEKYKGLGTPIRICVGLFLLYALLVPQVIYLQTSGNARVLTRSAVCSLLFTLTLLTVLAAVGHATTSTFIAAEVCGAALLATLLAREIHRLRDKPTTILPARPEAA